MLLHVGQCAGAFFMSFESLPGSADGFQLKVSFKKLMESYLADVRA